MTLMTHPPAIPCTVLLFAQLADSIGERELAIELAPGATVADALTHLAARYEPIAALDGHLAVAVDEQYRPPTTPLTPGCTIALIPPVSGG